MKILVAILLLSTQSFASGVQSAHVQPGTVLSYAGYNAPSGYTMGDGGAISRTTYSNLESAITIKWTSVSCTNGSPTITLNGTSPNSSNFVATGMNVESISGCTFPSGTTILSIGSTTSITLSNSASSTSSSGVITVFPYGNGNGSTTFNVPDCRGRVIAGLDNMFTSAGAASRLTASRSQGVNAVSLGATGGEQAHTQTGTELANHQHIQSNGHDNTGNGYWEYGGTVSFSPYGSTTISSATYCQIAISTGQTCGGPGTIRLDYTSDSNTLGPGTASTAMNVVQPTIAMNCIVKL